MKIVFFGTSERSFPILNSLKSNFDLVLCVTKKDQKVGRKQELKECAVKTWAKKKKIDFVEIDNLRNSDLKKVLAAIKKKKADYGVVCDFSIIIPEDVIQLFGKNLVNVHFSLLPNYRGACPVQFAILYGVKNTGVTFHVVDPKLDHGEILHQIVYTMDQTETSGELYETLFKISAEKLPEVLKNYSEGTITPLPQEENEVTYTYSPSHPTSTFIYKEDAEINWKEKPEVIERKVRAFNPWPIAWSSLGELESARNLSTKIKLKPHINKGLKVKIYKSELDEGKLRILDLQVEGKNRMAWKAFENGYLV
ncbi:methionyl-tRNA formyltransferase [Patescibacteria group bacterium]